MYHIILYIIYYKGYCLYSYRKDNILKSPSQERLQENDNNKAESTDCNEVSIVQQRKS